MSNYLNHQTVSLKNIKYWKKILKMIKIIWISQSFSWCFEYLAEKSKTNLSQNYQENCATCLKFLIFLLNWFRSGSQELSNKISPLPSNKLYFRDSKFLGLYSVLFCLFVFILYLRASKKTTQPNNKYLQSLITTRL